MLILHLPKTFKIGDTIDYRTPNETVQITWRDAKTIVIEPDDARIVLFAEVMEEQPEPVRMICATDKGVAPSEYRVYHLDPDCLDDEDVS
jgi:hypothetical protein